MIDSNSERPAQRGLQEHVQTNTVESLVQRNTQLWAAYQQNGAVLAQLSTRHDKLKDDLTQALHKKECELTALQQAHQDEREEISKQLKMTTEDLKKAEENNSQIKKQVTGLQAKIKQVEDAWKVTSE